MSFNEPLPPLPPMPPWTWKDYAELGLAIGGALLLLGVLFGPRWLTTFFFRL